MQDNDYEEYKAKGSGRFEDLKYNAKFLGKGIKKMSTKKAFLLMLFMFVAVFVLFILQCMSIIPEYILFIALLGAMLAVLFVWLLIKRKNRL